MRWHEIAEDKSLGYATSKHGTNLHKYEKSKQVKPGTEKWFKLWFTRPFLTKTKNK